jgi:hypothetical protein
MAIGTYSGSAWLAQRQSFAIPAFRGNPPVVAVLAGEEGSHYRGFSGVNFSVGRAFSRSGRPTLARLQSAALFAAANRCKLPT